MSAERRSGYSVTSLSKRAASSGEKMVDWVANAYSSSKTFAVNASAATSSSSLPRRSRQRYQAVFADFELAALEHSLGPGVIFISGPASGTGCGIIFQRQNFTFTAKGESSVFAFVNQSMLADGLTQIVRRYIRRMRAANEIHSSAYILLAQCYCRHFSPLSLRPLLSLWQGLPLRARKLF